MIYTDEAVAWEMSILQIQQLKEKKTLSHYGLCCRGIVFLDRGEGVTLHSRWGTEKVMDSFGVLSQRRPVSWVPDVCGSINRIDLGRLFLVSILQFEWFAYHAASVSVHELNKMPITRRIFVTAVIAHFGPISIHSCLSITVKAVFNQHWHAD